MTEETLWEGTSATLTSVATKGKVATKYRLTTHSLYVESGVLSTNAQQIPLLSVHDVDMKQSMTQKARGVGDVLVHVTRPGHIEVMTLEAIKDPRDVRDKINNAVQAARVAAQQAANTRTVHAAGVTTPASAQGDVMAQLKQLGDLKDAGVLTQEEFDAKKAELLGRL
jgi:uncharacterized membrane protein YdbT with pleckstrin-like domain